MESWDARTCCHIRCWIWKVFFWLALHEIKNYFGQVRRLLLSVIVLQLFFYKRSSGCIVQVSHLIGLEITNVIELRARHQASVIMCAAFSPNGRFIAVLDRRGFIDIWFTEVYWYFGTKYTNKLIETARHGDKFHPSILTRNGEIRKMSSLGIQRVEFWHSVVVAT